MTSSTNFGLTSLVLFQNHIYIYKEDFKILLVYHCDEAYSHSIAQRLQVNSDNNDDDDDDDDDGDNDDDE
jgi:hypothetical protein